MIFTIPVIQKNTHKQKQKDKLTDRLTDSLITITRAAEVTTRGTLPPLLTATHSTKPASSRPTLLTMRVLPTVKLEE